MFWKRQVSVNITELDKEIGRLSTELKGLEEEDDYELNLAKLKDLTDLRCKLAESKVEGSVRPVVVSGLLSITSVMIILKYEETDVITSKAYSIATSMFRGSK